MRIVRSALLLALALTVGVADARAQAQAPAGAPIADPGAFRPLTVGSDLTFPPFAFRQPDGKIAGFSVDVAWEIAKRLGRPGVDMIETPVAGLFPGLNAKRYEFIAAPIAVTQERAQQMLFTEGYLSTGLGVLLHSDDPDLKSLEELKGKAIAVVRGSAADAWAAENAGKLGVELQRLDRAADAPYAVVDRKVYAAILDLPLALQAVKQVKLVRNGFTVLTGRVIAFAFRQDDAAFRNRVELIVEDMKRDGTLAGIYQAWFGARPPEGSVMLTIDDASYGPAGFPATGRNRPERVVAMKLKKDKDLRRQRRDALRPHPVADQLIARAAQYYGAGAFVEARAVAEEALKHRPNHPDALNVLGAVLAELGDPEGAVAALSKAVAVVPAAAGLRANLSLALKRAARAPEAAVQAREAIRLEPLNPSGHDMLCAALCEMGNPAAAVPAGREAVRLAPRAAGAWLNLGTALLDSGAAAEAEQVYLEAIGLAPTLAEAWSFLGRCQLHFERYDEAVASYRKALELRRSTAWWPQPGRTPAMPPRAQLTNTVKLRHDIEQLKHLQSGGRLPAGAERLLPAYGAVLADFVETHGAGANAPLSPRQWETLGSAYNRVLAWEPPTRVPGSALGGFDRERAMEQYAVPPGIVWIDDFLSPGVVTALHAFCMDATIWSDISHNFQNAEVARGYLGAYMNDGFVAPLLFQVAEDLTRALPTVFKHHRLRQMWAYKYETELQGIGLHGDDAAVNVNFWITPDSANLDADGGGLLVYPIEAPPEWSFKDMNLDHARMWRFLDESGAAPVNVPYRQNRAVIFNSDLFHATAPLNFKPGYENRRINITMLFGRRGE